LPHLQPLRSINLFETFPGLLIPFRDAFVHQDTIETQPASSAHPNVFQNPPLQVVFEGSLETEVTGIKPIVSLVTTAVEADTKLYWSPRSPDLSRGLLAVLMVFGVAILFLALRKRRFAKPEQHKRAPELQCKGCTTSHSPAVVCFATITALLFMCLSSSHLSVIERDQSFDSTEPPLYTDSSSGSIHHHIPRLPVPTWQRTSKYYRCSGFVNGVATGNTWPVPQCFDDKTDQSDTSRVKL
jgi:hypothetical protein